MRDQDKRLKTIINIIVFIIHSLSSSYCLGKFRNEKQKSHEEQEKEPLLISIYHTII